MYVHETKKPDFPICLKKAGNAPPLLWEGENMAWIRNFSLRVPRVDSSQYTEGKKEEKREQLLSTYSEDTAAPREMLSKQTHNMMCPKMSI